LSVLLVRGDGDGYGLAREFLSAPGLKPGVFMGLI